ncbi:hypothetical protein [uncultured Paludibaculum sp.]|uniref:hypothetical protein n=1 Tax=uncultured Paludibaculum sp. TaxID=1765020 RepID=UPI002AAC10C7|nr:hypothetical protein [uncultured Paludibaculum sp.]
MYATDTAEEFTAWTRLDWYCFLYGPVKKDTALMCAITRLSAKRWPSVWARVSERFVEGEEPGTITTPDAQHDRAISLGRMAQQVADGRRGGRPPKLHPAERQGDPPAPAPDVEAQAPPHAVAPDPAPVDPPRAAACAYSEADLVEMTDLLRQVMSECVRASGRPDRAPSRADVLRVARAANGTPWRQLGALIRSRAKKGAFEGATSYGLVVHLVEKWTTPPKEA